MAGHPEQPPLRLSDLAGRWHIVATNFPMWLSGRKLRPTFNYTERDGGLADVVEYQQGGRTRRIAGFDTATNASNRAFTWRGHGLLWLFVSRWNVIHIEDGWMLIGFDKTLATPAGADLGARSEIQREIAEAKFTELAHLLPAGQPQMKMIV